MNLIQFKNKLKSLTYTIPKCNYKFLNRIVVSGEFDYPITERLSSEQYSVYYKLMVRYAND